MGAVKRDIHVNERMLTQTYALNDAAGVKALLRDRYRIAERRFRGDTAASDILIDLNSAIESASLTERQTEAIAYVYGKWQLTQKEAAEAMGVGQDSVSDFVNGAAERIAAVFRRWEYGSVTVELTEGETQIDV